MLVGTPNYMSPEQLNGGAIDTRADIFAAGAVCYELLSMRARLSRQSDRSHYTRILTRAIRSLAPRAVSNARLPDIAAVVEEGAAQASARPVSGHRRDAARRHEDQGPS